MHPFFKPVLIKTNRALFEPETEASERQSTKAAAGHSLQQEDGDVHIGHNNLQDGSHTSSQESIYEYADDHGEIENLDIEVDPNLGRRKRQKTAPFDESKATSDITPAQENTDDDGSWLVQLQEAVNPATTVLQSPAPVQEVMSLSPPTSPRSSPVELAIRLSPTKTPRKPQLTADTPAETPPSFSRPNTRSSSAASKKIISPAPGATPKQKFLKLTSKGKLLSSPPSVSPASKRKLRGKNTKSAAKSEPEPRKVARLQYGTDPESRTKIGSQIDSILSQRTSPNGHDQAKIPEPPKATHPFFTSKPVRIAKSEVIVIDDDSLVGNSSDVEGGPHKVVTKPKDWKDLGFKRNQATTTKAVDAVLALWPPKDMQHVGLTTTPSPLQHKSLASMICPKSSKLRKDFLRLSDKEDILQIYGSTLEHHRGQVRDTFPLPEKRFISGREIVVAIEKHMSSTPGQSPGSYALQDWYPQAFERMESRIFSGASSIDCGLPGTAESWLSNSAPTRTGQVLQVQCRLLHEWLAIHQVHHTATKLSAVPKKKAVRKKRRRKKIDELDDFIATSDDEDGEGIITAKNALLIVGPNGCGKTASVYAVAKELDFEVFEIHPGMRRTAKDIFDKVGDMTQNHLVHRATQLDQERQSTPDSLSAEISSGESVPGSKNAMKSFLKGAKQTTRKEGSGQSRPATPQTELGQKSQNRKQSLILFEEVDILFEEDRGFWAGVIQLIEQSKRPVVLTCNDPTSVFVADLPLYASLKYEQVPVDLAVDYILMLAAAEGHWLEREAVRSLYLTKRMDLRATISELDFWCQMAVGSEKAGLDWIIEHRSSVEASKVNGDDLKLFSKDTYTTGMGLVPRTLLASRSSHGKVLQYAQDELSVPLLYWYQAEDGGEEQRFTTTSSVNASTVDGLEHSWGIAEANSVLELLNNPVGDCSDLEQYQKDTISAGLAASTLDMLPPKLSPASITDIASAHLKVKAATSQLNPETILTAFEPLMTEKPQFPPSLGRLAPSLEISSPALMADIAPYVRSIVRCDQRLEEQRDFLAGGSQRNKVRKSRASRAALEGGSKATTREEKWFPKRTDYSAVLRTGGTWPLWTDGTTRLSSDGSPGGSESTATSPAADIVMIDDGP